MTLQDLENKVHEFAGLIYHNDKAIVLYKNEVSAHIKMNRMSFVKLENAYNNYIYNLLDERKSDIKASPRVSKTYLKHRDRIIQLYPEHTVTGTAKILGISYANAQNIISRMIKNGELEARKWRPTPLQKFVLENYKLKKPGQMAKEFGTNTQVIGNTFRFLKSKGLVGKDENIYGRKKL